MDVLTAAASYYFFCANYQHMLTIRKHKVNIIKKPRNKRRWWMLQIHRNRTKESMEENLNKMLTEPSNEFHNFCRMTYSDFELLLQKLGPIISKKDTKWRDAIPSKIRLAVTLRFLASGDSYRSLHYHFKISAQIISKIVQEVCIALHQVLKDNVELPSAEDEWLAVEHGFSKHFPHAVGAIAGKRVALKAPTNHNKPLTIVLTALLDSEYCFLNADIGCQNRISDDSVFKDSILWNKLDNNLLRLPAPAPLPSGNIEMPYVFLGDEAFALHINLMKPYPDEHQEGTKEIQFNRKLSSARVVVENTFGLMSSVFRVLRQPLLLEPEPATQVVLACIVLHNFLRKSKHSAALYNPPGTYDVYNGDTLIRRGAWRSDIPDSPTLRDLRHTPSCSPRSAITTRDEFAIHFHH